MNKREEYLYYECNMDIQEYCTNELGYSSVQQAYDDCAISTELYERYKLYDNPQ